MRQIIISFLPGLDVLHPILYGTLLVVVGYFAVASKSVTSFAVAILIVISAMKPIAYQPLAGVKGVQLIYLWWVFALGVVFFNRISLGRSFRLRELLPLPVLLLVMSQLLAWIMTFIAGAHHTYYVAGFTREELFLGYLLSPIQVLVSGWMVAVATENEEEAATITKAFLISAAIFGGLITFIYLKRGAFSGGADSLFAGRDAVNELMGEEVNGMGGVCVLFFIGCVLLGADKNRKLSYLATPLTLLGTLFTLSRMAWVSIVIVTALTFPRFDWRKRLIAVVVIFFCLWQFHTMIINRMWFGFDKEAETKVERADEVTAGRVSLWKEAWDKSMESPLIGFGVQTAVRMSDGRIAFHPHSAYLRVLLDMGWVGMLIVVTCYIHLLVRASKNKGPLYYSIITLAIMGIVCLEFHIHKQTYLIWMYYGLQLNEKAKARKTQRVLPKLPGHDDKREGSACLG